MKTLLAMLFGSLALFAVGAEPVEKDFAGKWRFDSDAGWFEVRSMRADGTFVVGDDVGLRKAEGSWKVVGSQMILTKKGETETFILPIDPKGIAGKDGAGRNIKATKLGSEAKAPSSQVAESEQKPTGKDGMLYAIPVPGKLGFVKSPYAKDNGYIDVRGMPKDTKVKDPHTQKVFLVP